jgi:hypothetical protein
MPAYMDVLPELQIRPRSSLSKRGIYCALGTIDFDYRDEIKVCLHNLSKDTFVINPGDRVAQLVPALMITTQVLQAIKEGKPVEYGVCGQWHSLDPKISIPPKALYDADWRVVPQPKTVEMTLVLNGSHVGAVLTNKYPEICDLFGKNCKIKIEEIL